MNSIYDELAKVLHVNPDDYDASDAEQALHCAAQDGEVSAVDILRDLAKVQEEFAKVALRAADRNEWQDVALKVATQRDRLVAAAEQVLAATEPTFPPDITPQSEDDKFNALLAATSALRAAMKEGGAS